MPRILRAAAASEPSFSGAAHSRHDPSPWEELFVLLHQHSIYSATYAALPHLAELSRTGSQAVRQFILDFVGTVRVFGRLEGELPSDLLPACEAATQEVRRTSLEVVRGAGLAHPLELPHLLSAFAGLRHPQAVEACALPSFDGTSWELEVDECWRCEASLLVEMTQTGPVTLRADAQGHRSRGRWRVPVDRSTYPARLAVGQRILGAGPDPAWPAEMTANAVAALAAERGQNDLATRLLDLEAEIACPHCGDRNDLSEVLRWAGEKFGV